MNDRNGTDDESALRVARKCRADIDLLLRDVSKILDSSKHALGVQQSAIAAMQALFVALARRLTETERNAIAEDLRDQAKPWLRAAPDEGVSVNLARTAGFLAAAADAITGISALEAEILSKLRNPPDGDEYASAGAPGADMVPMPTDDPHSNVRRIR